MFCSLYYIAVRLLNDSYCGCLLHDGYIGLHFVRFFQSRTAFVDSHYLLGLNRHNFLVVRFLGDVCFVFVHMLVCFRFGAAGELAVLRVALVGNVNFDTLI